jgi:hypothetical protein
MANSNYRLNPVVALAAQNFHPKVACVAAKIVLLQNNTSHVWRNSGTLSFPPDDLKK